MLWMALSGIWTDWKSALAIVGPETVISWQRRGFQAILVEIVADERTRASANEREIRTLVRTMAGLDSLFPTDLAVEPGFGKIPFAKNRTIGYLQNQSGFLDAQSSEKAQLNHTTFAWIDFGELRQCFIEYDEIAGFFRLKDGRFVQRRLSVPSSLGSLPSSCDIHQDSAHELCGHRKKVSPVLPSDIFPADQPNVGFVDQGSRLQRMIWPLSCHVSAGQAVKLSVHSRGELFESLLVSFGPGLQQRCQFMFFGRSHASLKRILPAILNSNTRHAKKIFLKAWRFPVPSSAFFNKRWWSSQHIALLRPLGRRRLIMQSNSTLNAQEMRHANTTMSFRRRGSLVAVATVLIAILALSHPRGATAQEEEGRNPACSNATLRGDYGILVSGIRQAGPGATEMFISVALRTYDGHGSFTQIGDAHGQLTGASRNGHLTGTYNVNPNCTGTTTIFFPGAPSPGETSIVIVDRGKEVKEVVMSPQTNLVTAVQRRK
jgi:hypothetical protein